MGIYLGNTSLKNISLGGSSVKSVHLGSDLVWPKRKPSSSTVAYYPLTSSTTVNDMSGNNYHLTNSGVQFGVYNGVDCGYFNGSSYASLSQSLFIGNPTFTVSIYAKAVSFTTYNGHSVRFIGSGSDNYSFGIFISSNVDGHKLMVGGWSNDQGTGYVVNTNWHHITFSYSGGNGSIYVDGTNIYNGTRSPNIQNNRTVLGANPNLIDWITGYLSNFICENKARTSDEVLAYYNQTKSNYGL